MGIWQAVDQLPYARKATEERLVGDRYILKVQNTTIAELIGDKSAQLSTSVYVNNEPQALTRAAANGPSTFGDKYVDENGIIHPAVIHLTDPDGYDQAYHNETDKPAPRLRAARQGRYDYITAEERHRDLVKKNVRERLEYWKNIVILQANSIQACSIDGLLIYNQQILPCGR